MEHKPLSRILLLAGAIAVAGILFFFALVLPQAMLSFLRLSARTGVFWGLLMYLWLIAALYLAAMVQYLMVCRRIGENRSFCFENVRSLGWMARLLFAAAALWLAAPCLAALLGMLSRPVLLSLLLSMASLAMGLLAQALSGLLRRVAALQEENDLTI